MPTIRACLEHRHSYVRRNAVLAIFTIYRQVLFVYTIKQIFVYLYVKIL